MEILKKLKIFGLILFVCFVFLASSINVKADENLQFRVDHVAGKVEKLKEKISLFLKFNKESKTSYYQYLVEKRLAEISYIIEKNDIDSVEPTASRYSTYIGILGNYVDTNKVSEKKNDLINMYERHIKILTELQKKFKYDSGWWLAIQNDINVDKLFVEKMKSL